MLMAYPQCYIDDFSDTFGYMFQYVSEDCGIDTDDFFDWLIVSKVARQIQLGNPKYVAGMSGPDIAREVFIKTFGREFDVEPKYHTVQGVDFWSGSMICYYAWQSGMSFAQLRSYGIKPSVINKMYIQNRNNKGQFVADVMGIVEKNKSSSALAYFRKMMNMTQKELAESSGVPLRMIQLYEQGQNDLAHAKAEYVLKLANTLKCTVAQLLTE